MFILVQMVMVRRGCRAGLAIPGMFIPCFEYHLGHILVGRVFKIVLQQSTIKVGVCSVWCDGSGSGKDLVRQTRHMRISRKTATQLLTLGKIQDNAMLTG
jgi:hypothetical protein